MRYHTVITCVNFSDYLESVYPHNKSVIQNLSILSSTTDNATKNFCINNNIYLYQTDIFFADNNPINRAAAMNEFFLTCTDRLNNDEWILFTDADTIFAQPMECIISLDNIQALDANQIISCPRKIYKDSSNYPDGDYTLERGKFLGYFQFFHKNIIMPEILAGIKPFYESENVSRHDIEFVNKYWGDNENNKLFLSDCYAIHYGQTGIYWRGRQ